MTGAQPTIPLSTPISIASAMTSPIASTDSSCASLVSSVPVALAGDAVRSKRRKVRRKWRMSAMSRRTLHSNGGVGRGARSDSDSSSDDEVDDHKHSRSCCVKWVPVQVNVTEWWQRFALLALILFFVYAAAWLLLEPTDPRPLVYSIGTRKGVASASQSEPMDNGLSRHFVPFASAAEKLGPTARYTTFPVVRVQQAVALAAVPISDAHEPQRQEGLHRPAKQAARPPANEADDNGDRIPPLRRQFINLHNSNINQNLRRQSHPQPRDDGQRLSRLLGRNGKRRLQTDLSAGALQMPNAQADVVGSATTSVVGMNVVNSVDSERWRASGSGVGHTQLRLSYVLQRHSSQMSTLKSVANSSAYADGSARLALSNDPLWLVGPALRSAASDVVSHCLPQAFDLYEYTARSMADGESIAVTVSLRSQCADWEMARDPTSFFRVFVAGYAVAAATEVLILSSASSKRSISTRVAVPDAGVYCVYVRLNIFQSTDDLAGADFVDAAAAEQVAGTLVDEYVWPVAATSGLLPHHPFTCLAVTKRPLAGDAHIVTNAMTAPLSGNFANFRLASSPVPTHPNSFTTLPLCGSSGHHVVHGRWSPYRLSAESAASTAVVASTNLLGGSMLADSQFRPYDCEIDSTLGNKSPVELVRQRLSIGKWLHFVGDSVTRALFIRLCQASGIDVLESAAFFPGIQHTPLACDGGDFFLTYTPWWYRGPNLFPGKSPPGSDHSSTALSEELPLYPGWTFDDYCSKYKDSSPETMRLGWPGCRLAAPSIRSLSMPSVTYFSMGVEVIHMGAEAFAAVFQSVVSAPFFRNAPTLFALNSAVHSAYIPRSMTRQWLLQNNIRIQRQNEQIVDGVKKALQAGNIAAAGNTQNWLPIFDMFWPSFTAYEYLLADALHFQPAFLNWAIDYLLHFLQHAPNFKGAH